MLEDEIVKLGGKYEKAAEPWGVSHRAGRNKLAAERVAGSRRRIRKSHYWTKPRFRKRYRRGHSSSIEGIDVSSKRAQSSKMASCIAGVPNVYLYHQSEERAKCETKLLIITS